MRITRLHFIPNSELFSDFFVLYNDIFYPKCMESLRKVVITVPKALNSSITYIFDNNQPLN